MKYASFLIRLWLQNQESGSVIQSLHGRIEHIQGEELLAFEKLEDLTDFFLMCLSTAEGKGEKHDDANH